MDNGKEFCTNTPKITKALKAETYFLSPYHSWEKGLNENTNGLIRNTSQTKPISVTSVIGRYAGFKMSWTTDHENTLHETPSVLFLNRFQPLIHQCCTEIRNPRSPENFIHAYRVLNACLIHTRSETWMTTAWLAQA